MRISKKCHDFSLPTECFFKFKYFAILKVVAVSLFQDNVITPENAKALITLDILIYTIAIKRYSARRLIESLWASIKLITITE
jgi:hypothetical protein